MAYNPLYLNLFQINRRVLICHSEGDVLPSIEVDTQYLTSLDNCHISLRYGLKNTRWEFENVGKDRYKIRIGLTSQNGETNPEHSGYLTIKDSSWHMCNDGICRHIFGKLHYSNDENDIIIW